MSSVLSHQKTVVSVTDALKKLQLRTEIVQKSHIITPLAITLLDLLVRTHLKQLEFHCGKIIAKDYLKHTIWR